MAGTGKLSSKAGKLVRSETVTIRLDPRLRYLAELCALKQRRTVSSFIEWAIGQSLHSVALGEDQDGAVTVANQAAELWDVDEPDRFIKLATLYPDLLTHDQQRLWKLIRETDYFWGPWRDKQVGEWLWHTNRGSVVLERLRKHWGLLHKVLQGDAPKSDLPSPEIGSTAGDPEIPS